jgi:hypothetical protein
MKLSAVVGHLLILGVLNVPMAVRSHQAASSACEVPVLVEVKRDRGHINYKIDSKIVTDPLDAFAKVAKQKGSSCPVVALFSWGASLREVYDIEATASKAGFRTVRSFVVKNGFMSEIKFGPGIPLSSNPPL